MTVFPFGDCAFIILEGFIQHQRLAKDGFDLTVATKQLKGCSGQ